MIIHNVPQGSPEWHTLRQSIKRTGSVASAMMGVGKNIKRNELLHMMATGSEQEFSDWVQEHILDKGHEYEAMARPIAENIVGDDLFPACVSSDDGYMMLSLDGMTMAEDMTWEHKQPNAELVAEVVAGRCPDYHYWQVVQGLAITGAEKCLFMVSDGTEENCVWCWVERNESDCAKLVAGWKQFDADLAAYVPPEIIPAAVAAPVKDLPAVIYKMDGLALTSNLPAFKAASIKLVEDSKRPMETDQDFADRIELCKKFGEAEKKIELLQSQVVGEIHDVNEFCVELGEISKMFKQARLAGEKLVEAEKANRKNSILAGAKSKWAEHIAGLNLRLGKPYMPEVLADFVLATKGLKSMTSMQNAVDTLLAKSKLAANEIADKIDVNMRTLRELAAQHAFLFADTPTLVLKANDDLVALVKMRIAEHQEAEAARLEAETARIRAEEQAKAQREADARIAAERAEAQRVAEAEQAERKASMAASCVEELPKSETQPALSSIGDTQETIKLGEICTRLGFTVTADFLATLGINPSATDKNAKLYPASKFSTICRLISEHVMSLAFKKAA